MGEWRRGVIACNKSLSKSKCMSFYVVLRHLDFQYMHMGMLSYAFGFMRCKRKTCFWNFRTCKINISFLLFRYLCWHKGRDPVESTPHNGYFSLGVIGHNNLIIINGVWSNKFKSYYLLLVSKHWAPSLSHPPPFSLSRTQQLNHVSDFFIVTPTLCHIIYGVEWQIFVSKLRFL